MNTLSTKSQRQKIIASLVSPLKNLLSHPTATNIFIMDYKTIYYDDKGSRHLLKEELFGSEQQLIDMIVGMARQINTNFDESNPFIFSTLPEGQRFTAVHSTIKHGSPMVTIRLFPKVRITLDDLLKWGSIDAKVKKILISIIEKGNNFLVVGSTDSGKTTLLNSMLQIISTETKDHILIAEDTRELSLPECPLITQMTVPDVLIDKSTNKEKMKLGKLIEASMRLTGDRLIVGEIRCPDAASGLYDALNTGSTGVCSTIHANSASDAISRIASLASCERNMPHDTLVNDFKSFLDYSVFVKRDRKTWERYVDEILFFPKDGDEKQVSIYKKIA